MFWTGSRTDRLSLALPFMLLALDNVVHYYLGDGITHLRWAGLWLGLASWFKHDVAAYVAVGVV